MASKDEIGKILHIFNLPIGLKIGMEATMTLIFDRKVLLNMF